MVHGLFHKKGVGNLKVEFKYDTLSQYQVKITDDGIGFIEMESERISSTKVINDRVKLINDAGDFKLKIEKSFLDDNKMERGTVITITIKDERKL